MAEGPALFRRYPLLAERLPRIPILTAATPVERLVRLEESIQAGPIWVKRDDLSAEPYGGNKPRKLEFLLGAARARGSRTLITFGGLGSNHALATAVYGRRHGFSVVTILVPQPDSDSVRTNLRALHTLGACVICVPNDALAAVAAARAWAVALIRDGRLPYLIPPGGASPVGSTGYVDGALELGEQIGRGELPAPEAIFAANGSAGTAAGLLVGLRLAGLRSRLVVVRVSDRLPTGAAAIARLAAGTLDRLRRASAGEVPHVRLTAADVEVREGYLGRGYGHATTAGERAVRLLADSEGLTLDQTYTGKTMAAVLDTVGADFRGRPVLYWHTFNSRPVADEI